MRSPQNGIFALGTSAHAYLEFDALSGDGGLDLVGKVASLREPRTTMGGINLVAGFRPELWRSAAPEDAPLELDGFNAELVGVDGFAMPATQHDAVLWLSGSAYDVVFDAARAAIAELEGLASVAEETSSWSYLHDRDLTGFIDGSENPTLIEAPGLVLVPDGKAGAGGTVLLLQKWTHDAAAWEALAVAEQERVIGRTKPDSVELEDKPATSHVASTDQERFGDIFRRNMPYGTVTDHGTMFVGFASERRPLQRCSRAWPASSVVNATRLRASPGHSPAPTTSCRRSNRCSRLEGGRFLIQRAANEHPDFPDSLPVIGVMEGDNDLSMQYFDSRGVHRVYAVAFDGRELMLARDEPGFAQRLSVTLSDDGSTFSGVWQLNQGDQGYRDDLAFTFRRASGNA